MKTLNLNMRVSDEEKKRILALADYFTASDVTNLQRHLFKAAEVAMKEHGSRTLWPPVLNFYPPETKTQQELLEDDTPGPEKPTS